MGFREEDSFGVVAVVVGSGDGASTVEWVAYRAGEVGGIGGAAGAVCGRGEAGPVGYDGGMSAEDIPRISLDEFLELESNATHKSEYWDGQVFAMAGGTYDHALIASNVMGVLRERLRGQPCRVIGSDLLVEAAEDGLLTYPDVIVICGEPRFVGPKPLVVSNPVLVVEVLSPSTEGRDRGRKATQYRKNRTLQQYVLVASDEARVEVIHGLKAGVGRCGSGAGWRRWRSWGVLGARCRWARFTPGWRSRCSGIRRG